MECSLKEHIITLSFAGDESMMEMGSGNYGCSHYRRRCKIRAPCCDEIFDCRHCHNDSKNSLDVDPLKRHDIPRHDIEKVICSLCNTEQDVQQKCIQCGICMGKYFCSKCNFFDDDVSKNQYHCDRCGICRTGGEENFFHCDTCGCCYTNLMKESHICIERAMHHNCPVCFEVASTAMPEIYQNKMVWILCNDCAETSEVNFHIVAHKCPSCKSYNTRQTRGGTSSCSNITEMVR
ncbi:E3 ubiquitin-protein ligase RZFP34 isoform X3 [Solanum dulcamara]|uniref:E3 ubiquitin-protein ligase RZFP34 isoform X3 n=1 Tax=Solanum dulcamara TaxID=45834 RepID=UPI002484E7E8|nr:E3 ubiquitin-protein ligase RZFP34 isoform X3 [Solanum dulcamara]